VNTSQYLQALERDGFALARAAEDNLDAEVAACPGWRVADLVWHMGEVHWFWGTVAERRLQDAGDAPPEPERPGDDALVEWFRAGLGRLLGTLSTADPATKVWTWAPRKDVGFIHRRMAQETAVHRWDAEAAAGRPTPIDGELAADGIDEFLAYFLPSAPDRLSSPGESIHLHATDAAGEWVVTVRDGAVQVAKEHAKGDAAVRGQASDLLLLLWRRVDARQVEVLGDHAALLRFLERADLT
jgi:uncharacterized protein (TIGR03083 family)